jgi:hypothetical protein
MSQMLQSILIMTLLFRHTTTVVTVIVTTVAVMVTTVAAAMILEAVIAVMILEAATVAQILAVAAVLAAAETNPPNTPTASDCYDLFIAITFFIKSSSLFVHPARNTC